MKRELIGRVFPPFYFKVTREKIIELVQAIGDPNPIYRDPMAAKEQGYRDIVAPPTFVTLAGHWTGALYKLLEEIGVDFSRVLHGEEEYEYMEEIYPEDVLTGQLKILFYEEKNSNFGPIELIKLETIFCNQYGKQVICAESKILITKSSGGDKID